MRAVFSFLRLTITLLLVFTLLLGGVYPLAVTAVAQIFFPDKATGSLMVRGDKVIGSALLGQEFSDPKYFWGRLSATVPPYNAAASSGSNLGQTNPKLQEAINARVKALLKDDPHMKMRIPVDLVTASASGLDPHISVAAAKYQVTRVAKARHKKEEEIQALVKEHSPPPLMGYIGEPRVNVLELNLALDRK